MSVRVLLDGPSDQDRLSVFQADPFGPCILLYGVADVSGHMSADTRHYPILPAKNRQMVVLFSIHLADRMKNRRFISI